MNHHDGPRAGTHAAPASGPGSRILNAFGVAMIAAVVLGMGAIARRDLPQHGAWMMRACGIGLATGVQRMIALPLFLTLGDLDDLTIGIIMWLGWFLTLGVVEWRLRRVLALTWHVPAALLIGATTVLASGQAVDETRSSMAFDLGEELDEHLARFVGYGFSGAVLVAKDGEVLLSKGYGLADVEKDRPVLPEETVFTVGSITKQFTGAAVLELEMEGKLDVEDSIAEYLDGVPADKTGITLHHLLTHTAGLTNVLGGDHDLQATRERVLQGALTSELEAPPGARYVYSNLGYSLLAMIVEEASGQEYEEFLHEHLFVPAGMTRTGYRIPAFDPADLAIGRTRGEPWGTVLGRPMLADGPCWNLRGNGGIHSTVGDLYRWHLALEGDGVLSPEAKVKYFAPHVSRGRNGRHYGYGWASDLTDRGTRLIHHSGGNGVFLADVHRYVDEDVVIVLASNTTDFPTEELCDHLARVVFQEPISMPPAVAQLDESALQRFAGIYEVDGKARVVVAVERNYLSLHALGPEGLEVLWAEPCSPTPEAELLRTRTRRVIESCGNGDQGPIVEAIGRADLADEIEAAYGELWGGLRAEHGSVREVEVLASRVENGLVVIYVQVEFEHGRVYRQQEWERRPDSPETFQLVGTGGWQGPPTTRFFPSSQGEFMTFAYEPESADLMQAVFEAEGSVGSPRLTISRAGSSVVATRSR